VTGEIEQYIARVKIQNRKGTENTAPFFIFTPLDALSIKSVIDQRMLR
jgi:hypothetical protein